MSKVRLKGSGRGLAIKLTTLKFTLYHRAFITAKQLRCEVQSGLIETDHALPLKEKKSLLKIMYPRNSLSIYKESDV